LIVLFGNGGEPRMMDPVFCTKKLEILSDGDMLVKFVKNPDDVRQRLKKSSVATLIEYLDGTASHRASLGDIERTFGQIVEEKNFKRWWNVTRKLIAKEPRLTLEEGNVTYLQLCGEPVSEEDQLMRQFEGNRNVIKKTSMAEKFVGLLKSNPAIGEYGVRMVEGLSTALASKTKKITAAEKFQACVIRNELAKLVGMNVDSLSPRLETLITEYPNLGKVCDGLQPSYYAPFLELMTRVFPDEWEKLCLGILKNCNDRLTNECIVYMKDNGGADLLRAALVKWLNEKSLRSALLQWIVKNRHAKKFEEVFSKELKSHELLRSIFWAIDNEALLGTGKARKIQLVELLCNDKTLIRDLLDDATDEIAADLTQTLLINQGIDTLS
jgi:hypothetical protein